MRTLTRHVLRAEGVLVRILDMSGRFRTTRACEETVELRRRPKLRACTKHRSFNARDASSSSFSCVGFLALAVHRAMVAAAMRTRFDIFGKDLVRAALEGYCSVETDAEV